MSRVVALNYQGNTVRAIVGTGQPAFVARDVCAALGIKNFVLTFAAMESDERDGRVAYTSTGERFRFMCFTMRGMKTIMQGRDVLFQRWYKHTVLPQLRQYVHSEQSKRVPQNFAEALETLATFEKEVSRLNAEIEMVRTQQQPTSKTRVIHTDEKPDDAMTMNQVAKTLRYGRNRLFVLLREKGLLMRDNLPYQKYLEQDLFRVRTVTIQTGQKSIKRTQTLVTPKGMDKIRKIVFDQSQESIAQ